jgi:hypothetical protein
VKPVTPESTVDDAGNMLSTLIDFAAKWKTMHAMVHVLDTLQAGLDEAVSGAIQWGIGGTEEEWKAAYHEIRLLIRFTRLGIVIKAEGFSVNSGFLEGNN